MTTIKIERIGLQGLRLLPLLRLQTSSRYQLLPFSGSKKNTVCAISSTQIECAIRHTCSADPGDSLGGQRFVRAADTRSHGGLAPHLPNDLIFRCFIFLELHP